MFILIIIKEIKHDHPAKVYCSIYVKIFCFVYKP